MLSDMVSAALISKECIKDKRAYAYYNRENDNDNNNTFIGSIISIIIVGFNLFLLSTFL